MKKQCFIWVLGILLLTGCGGSENKNIRKGNSSYDKANYSEAAEFYEKAVETNPSSIIAKFNLADAYYKLKQYRLAQQLFKELLPFAENDSTKLLQLYYNLGNTLLKSSFECMNKNASLSDSIETQQTLVDEQSNIVEKVRLGVQLDSLVTVQDSLVSIKDTLLLASITAYKNALRYDGKDQDAKYNLVYAMKYLPKNLQNSGSDQKKTEPSEYALKIKKQADSLISVYKFSEAYDLLSNGIEIDTTVKAFDDFIKKLKDVKDIL